MKRKANSSLVATCPSSPIVEGHIGTKSEELLQYWNDDMDTDTQGSIPPAVQQKSEFKMATRVCKNKKQKQEDC